MEEVQARFVVVVVVPVAAKLVGADGGWLSAPPPCCTIETLSIKTCVPFCPPLYGAEYTLICGEVELAVKDQVYWVQLLPVIGVVEKFENPDQLANAG